MSIEPNFLRGIKDELTGLKDRNKLMVDLKTNGFKLLFILNIDEFSLVNSSYGISIGDFVLKTISIRLQYLKEEEKFLVYRVSGDEFAIVYQEKQKNIKKVKEKANLLISRISENIQLPDGKEIIVNLTCGISFGYSDILRKAQIALKVARKNNLMMVIFKDSFNAISKKNEKNMIGFAKYKDAIQNGDFLVYYQPIVLNENKTKAKYEALCRLRYNNEIIYPINFIQLSKKLKIYNSVSLMIAEKAIEDFKHRKEILSINISIEDIYNPLFINKIMELGNKYKKLDNIVLEITESGNITDYKVVNKFIHKLIPYGIKISIDDFGTEYSNYEHVSNIDAHYLKIDGKFICDIDTNEKNYKLVESIVGLCKKLGIKTVAEYVSSEEIFNAVKKAGVDYSQGFYFGEAIPIEKI